MERHPRPQLVWPKHCSKCGKLYSEKAWDALPLLGYQNDDQFIVEMKNCACGGTMALEWERPKKNPADEVNETWVDNLLATPSLPQWKSKRAWKQGVFETPSGPMTMVLKKIPRGTWASPVLWYALSGRDVVAAGTARLVDGNDALVFGSSAVIKPLRRHGLYSAIIRAIRQLAGMPIESDVDMTPGAKKAWKKAGGKLMKPDLGADYRKAMRINPSRSR